MGRMKEYYMELQEQESKNFNELMETIHIDQINFVEKIIKMYNLKRQIKLNNTIYKIKSINGCTIICKKL